VKNRIIQLIACITSVALTGCDPPAADKDPPPILLFNGKGTSGNDVAAVEKILKDNHLKYSTVNSKQLNGMSESQLMAYRLMIIPGGNYITIGNSLTTNTTANIHNAVQGGLNYLGICAGGLLAGDAPCHSLNLTGVRFGFYAVVNRGVHKAAVAIASAGTPLLELTGRMALNLPAGARWWAGIPMGLPPSSKECPAKDGLSSVACIPKHR